MPIGAEPWERGKVFFGHEILEIIEREVAPLRPAADYDPHDRLGAVNFLQRHAAAGQVVTGLLYVDPEPEDLHRNFNTVGGPLNALAEADLCPGLATLEKINAGLR